MLLKSQQLAQPLTTDIYDDGRSCGLCRDAFSREAIVLDCLRGHVFHVRCFERHPLHATQNVCPSCGDSMHLDEADDVTINN